MKAEQRTTEELVDLLENGDDNASWDAAYALMRSAADDANGPLQAHIGRIMDIARSKAGLTKARAITVLGKLFRHADDSEEILDMLLLAARDPDANTRRASLFALSDCISDGTRDRILGVFQDLLADGAKTVTFAALEVLTETLPHTIRGGTLDRILRFLEADELSIRWRAVLAMNKAYPKLNAEDKDTALRVLRQAIESEDIFVKVRAHEALLNISDLEKRRFPEVDEALERESGFVRQWVLYNVDYR